MSGRECVRVLVAWADEAFLVGDWERFRALQLDIIILNRYLHSEN